MRDIKKEMADLEQGKVFCRSCEYRGKRIASSNCFCDESVKLILCPMEGARQQVCQCVEMNKDYDCVHYKEAK